MQNTYTRWCFHQRPTRKALAQIHKVAVPLSREPKEGKK